MLTGQILIEREVLQSITKFWKKDVQANYSVRKTFVFIQAVHCFSSY